MALTRNLYDMDEVESALLLSLRDCKKAESAFWCWELHVSLEHEIANRVLNDAWLFWGAGVDPLCLKDYEDLQMKYSRVVVAIEKGFTTKRTAVELLNVTGVMEYRPTMTPIAPSSEFEERSRERASVAVPSDMRNWWIALDTAVRQHHPVDAVWLLQAAFHRFPLTMIWRGVAGMARGPATCQEALNLLHLMSSSGDPKLYLVAAVLYLCWSTEERSQLPSDSHIRSSTWPPNEPGRRSSRLFAIPPEALTTTTTRGSISKKYTTIKDLQDLDLSTGCTFWQTVLEGVDLSDDTAKEAFYDHYFPDDIPDEWSKADQEKSHGRCVGPMDGSVPGVAPPRARFRPSNEPYSHLAWTTATHIRKIENGGEGDALCNQFDKCRLK